MHGSHKVIMCCLSAKNLTEQCGQMHHNHQEEIITHQEVAVAVDDIKEVVPIFTVSLMK